MTSSSNRRVRKERLDNMLTAAIPLMQLGDYAPFDQAISREQIARAVARVNAAREQEKLAADTYDRARHQSMVAERECYRLLLLARRHCVVQYGENSNVVRALGLKRRVEYKRRSRASGT